MTAELIRDRIASLCAGDPFGFRQSTTPFSFGLEQTNVIDGAFRIECEAGPIVGGFNFSEDRTDLMRIWVARKHQGDPEAMKRQLLTDVTSLRSAVIRDGLVQGGDYGVPDSGGGVLISHEQGQEYGVLRLTIPVNYEANV